MDKQKILFENFKLIKDYWVKASVDALHPNSDLIWSENEESYKILKEKLKAESEKGAYKKIMDEIVKGTIHSILVMIDGGDLLSDNYLLDLVVQETKESLKDNCALHEEFLGFLLNVEE